jgi:WXXGXW repeat (2 copies)
MRTTSVVRYLFFALFLLSVPTASSAQIGIYVSFGPPAIPVYDQPICPGDGYIWIPGYWAWDGSEYYWVPGTWVLPPEVGFLWTPGYWEWGGNGFFFHEGYWGPHVGWYGGINYGFGYFGHGYEGGHWDGRHFFYNRAVNNVDFNVIHNVYENREFYRNTNRVSYNGGAGGITERPNADELAFSRERHFAQTTDQTQHLAAARANRDLRAYANQGRPPIAATQRPGAFNDHAVTAREAGGSWEPPAGRGANLARPAIHPNDLPPLERSPAPYTGNPKLDQKYQQQQDKIYNSQVQDRQKLQQRQQREDQNLTRQNASTDRTQQMEQQHQQQTQQMQQRHEQQRQQIQQRQQSRH